MISLIFFHLGAFLLRFASQKPRFSGLRYRSGPACGVAAPRPSNRLRSLKASFAVKAAAKKTLSPTKHLHHTK
jgi:hypothetical protein